VPRDRASVVLFRSFDVPLVADAALMQSAGGDAAHNATVLTQWIDENASNYVEHVTHRLRARCSG
jgi:hypothetical protein